MSRIKPEVTSAYVLNMLNRLATESIPVADEDLNIEELDFDEDSNTFGSLKISVGMEKKDENTLKFFSDLTDEDYEEDRKLREMFNLPPLKRGGKEKSQKFARAFETKADTLVIISEDSATGLGVSQITAPKTKKLEDVDDSASLAPPELGDDATLSFERVKRSANDSFELSIAVNDRDQLGINLRTWSQSLPDTAKASLQLEEWLRKVPAINSEYLFLHNVVETALQHVRYNANYLASTEEDLHLKDKVLNPDYDDDGKSVTSVATLSGFNKSRLVNIGNGKYAIIGKHFELRSSKPQNADVLVIKRCTVDNKIRILIYKQLKKEIKFRDGTYTVTGSTPTAKQASEWLVAKRALIDIKSSGLVVKEKYSALLSSASIAYAPLKLEHFEYRKLPVVETGQKPKVLDIPKEIPKPKKDVFKPVEEDPFA